MTRQEWGTRGLFPFWLQCLAAASLLFTGWPGSAAESLPQDARRQLPAGFDVMTSATLSAGGRRFLLVDSNPEAVRVMEKRLAPWNPRVVAWP